MPRVILRRENPKPITTAKADRIQSTLVIWERKRGPTQPDFTPQLGKVAGRPSDITIHPGGELSRTIRARRGNRTEAILSTTKCIHGWMGGRGFVRSSKPRSRSLCRLLPAGPSRRYLCESFPGCLGPCHGGFAECICLFLPPRHRPSPVHYRGRLPAFPRRNDFTTHPFFETAAIPFKFRPPSLLASQIVPTAATYRRGAAETLPVCSPLASP